MHAQLLTGLMRRRDRLATEALAELLVPMSLARTRTENSRKEPRPSTRVIQPRVD